MKRPTSLLTRSKRGLTLIEILLVLTLLTLLITSVAPNFASVFRVSVKSGVRRLASVVRYAYDQSILTGRIHRVVIDLDKQQWFIESTAAGLLPLEDEENTNRGKEAPKGPAFQKVPGRVIGQLPSGVRIVSVDSWRNGKDAKPATEGQVFLYAYPSGLVDEATVTLSEDSKVTSQVFRVSTQPITGRVKIVSEETATP